MVRWLQLHASNAGGPGSLPGQGTRSHMPQLTVYMPYLRPSTAKYIISKKKKKLREEIYLNNTLNNFILILLD